MWPQRESLRSLHLHAGNFCQLWFGGVWSGSVPREGESISVSYTYQSQTPHGKTQACLCPFRALFLFLCTGNFLKLRGTSVMCVEDSLVLKTVFPPESTLWFMQRVHTHTHTHVTYQSVSQQPSQAGTLISLEHKGTKARRPAEPTVTRGRCSREPKANLQLRVPLYNLTPYCHRTEHRISTPYRHVSLVLPWYFKIHLIQIHNLWSQITDMRLNSPNDRIIL